MWKTNYPLLDGFCVTLQDCTTCIFTLNIVMSVFRQVSINVFIAIVTTIGILLAGIYFSIRVAKGFFDAILAGALTAGIALPVVILITLGLVF